jgi:xanthine dehydrogenase YagS FAD-binding subunit
MNAFDLLRPKTLDAAVIALTTDAPPTIKAGGVDLLDRMKEGLASPKQLLDILPLSDLRGIAPEDGKVRIGALTTLSELGESALLRDKGLGIVAEAARTAATPQVRAQATVGGNLHQHNRCWYYRLADQEPCLMRGGKECFAKEGRNKIHAIFGTDAPCVAVDPSSLAPVLLALDAVAFYKALGGVTPLTMDKVLVQGRNTVEATNQGVLTHVLVPVKEGRRSAFLEFGERDGYDWSLAACAVSWIAKGDACGEVRIVLGGVALTARRCAEAEKLLEGQKLTADLASKVAAKALEGAKPLAENGYKVPVARTLVQRALLAAAGLEAKK